MDYLENIFYMLLEESVPDTPEYRENKKLYTKLMEDVRAAMGKDQAEKVESVFTERETMECRRFFHYGIRLVLELLRL